MSKVIIRQGEYKHPMVTDPEIIRVITIRAFLNRIDQPTRSALRNSTDDIVIDLMEDLRMASYVDLDSTDLPTGLSYLQNVVNLITADDVVKLLADGTEAEKYRGVL